MRASITLDDGFVLDPVTQDIVVYIINYSRIEFVNSLESKKYSDSLSSSEMDAIRNIFQYERTNKNAAELYWKLDISTRKHLIELAIPILEL